MQREESVCGSSRVFLKRIRVTWQESFLRSRMMLVLLVFISIGLVSATAWTQSGPRNFVLNLEPFRDPTGMVSTLSTAGHIDMGSAFFQDLGTNGRTCATCHRIQNAFGLSASDARQVFMRTGGRDPLFATIDGANCPNVKPGDFNGHRLLVQNGLIRIALAVPVNAEFAISVVTDPYGCALIRDPSTGQEIVSVYRRPLPATNLSFLSAVMADGR